MKIEAIPAFSDNYIWCFSRDHRAVVVDPGDSAPVLRYMQANGLELAAILVTHHHPDHTGGVATLKRQYDCTVFGPVNPAIDSIDTRLRDGDTVTCLDLHFRVLTVPGHTLDHIAYVTDTPGEIPWLFCGDTLFAGGCGRLFEGDPVTMQQSLARLRELPPNTEVYCAHEYTRANLQFAIAVEPDNQVLQQRLREVEDLRRRDRITLPSTLALERQTNPFMRWDSPAVIQAARGRGSSDNAPASVFASIRAWKDSF